MENVTQEVSNDALQDSTLASQSDSESQTSDTSKPKSHVYAAKQRAKVKEVLPAREPVEINLKSLLEAGVHFGHQTSRWNPAMAGYIYGTRNGIHIINLPRTVQCWESARKCITEVISSGGSVLFVGTKKQAESAIVEEARRCGAFYVSRRWLGGMMTNFQTIRKSIARMHKVEDILAEEEKCIKEGTPTKFTKKERLMMSRELEKLEYSLGGIRDMYGPPQLLFVIDIKREDLAIKEAKRLDIPVIALVDTNCDPRLVTHPIPSNDDGTRAIKLFCQAVSDAVMEASRSVSKRKDNTVPVSRWSRRSKDNANKEVKQPDVQEQEESKNNENGPDVEALAKAYDENGNKVL